MDPEIIKGIAPEAERYKQHVLVIQNMTRQRREFLAKKKAKRLPFTVKEEFEEMILRMCDPNPLKRGSATMSRKKIERLMRQTR